MLLIFHLSSLSDSRDVVQLTPTKMAWSWFRISIVFGVISGLFQRLHSSHKPLVPIGKCWSKIVFHRCLRSIQVHWARNKRDERIFHKQPPGVIDWEGTTEIVHKRLWIFISFVLCITWLCLMKAFLWNVKDSLHMNLILKMNDCSFW